MNGRVLSLDNIEELFDFFLEARACKALALFVCSFLKRSQQGWVCDKLEGILAEFV